MKNNVKKIVVTSSLAAIFPGREDKLNFNEEDWSVPNKSSPYDKSKHLAEKKAWELYNQNKDKI